MSAKMPAPPSGRSSRATLVTTTCSRAIALTASATRRGSSIVVPGRPAGLDRAEAAGAGAGVAQDHDRGGALLPALPDVRAAGLLADRVEREVTHQALEIVVVGPGGQPRLDPLGVAPERRGAVGCGVAGGRRRWRSSAARGSGRPRRAAGTSEGRVAPCSPDGGLGVHRLEPALDVASGTGRPGRRRWRGGRCPGPCSSCAGSRSTSPAGPSMTTGRFTIASMVTMATSGTLMMGIVRMLPVQPVLSTVNVPPVMSSMPQPVGARSDPRRR